MLIMGGGGTVQDFGASQQFANVLMGQWQDYRARFVPYQNELLNTVNSRSMAEQDERFARTSVQQAFDAQRGAQTRDLGRMGVVMTAPQRAAVDQGAKLSASSQTVGSLNAARQHTLESDMAVMGAGMSSLLRNGMTQGAI
jgi:hypothetical protein